MCSSSNEVCPPEPFQREKQSWSTRAQPACFAKGQGRGKKVNDPKPQTLATAKSLRGNQTEAEARLWYHLRAHRFMGLKFKRQKPMGRYIVDFVCLEQRLIIEIDGGQHSEQVDNDQGRDAWLRSQGYRCCVSGTNVMQQLDSVLEQIRFALSPGPSPTSGRGE